VTHRGDGAAAAAQGAFVAIDDGSAWRFDGALTFDNAAAVIEAAGELPLPASGRIDLSGLDPADSSALAALFSLKRRAHADGRKLFFDGMPPGLASLARVYGVDQLLEQTP
jgi:phospholipid transport system transporter-binding protein